MIFQEIILIVFIFFIFYFFINKFNHYYISYFKKFVIVDNSIFKQQITLYNEKKKEMNLIKNNEIINIYDNILNQELLNFNLKMQKMLFLKIEKNNNFLIEKKYIDKLIDIINKK